MWLKAVALILIAYIFLNLIMPRIVGGVAIYLLTIVCWLTTTLVILKISMKEGANLIRWRFNKTTLFNALIIGSMQIVALTFIGLFTAFGKSPYAHTPTALIVNTTYFLSILLGLETSRAYLIKSCPKRKVFMGIGLTAFFYTFVSIPLTKFLTLGAPAETAKFLGSDFLPTLAQSLFATYLALLGGPTASISYLGTLEAFEWLCPLLPNPPWALKALITTLIPVIGFLTINQTVSLFKLMRLGVIGRSEAIVKIHKNKKTTPTGWITIALIAVILIWGSTGLLGFQPSIIASGSMRPTLDVGDVAITVQTTPNKIQVGDIIQYSRQGDQAPIIHRVIEISRAGATAYITTKGDANTAPDESIIASSTQRLGKVVLIMPKIGWISIYLKNFAAQTWAFLTSNAQAFYAILGITLITIAIGIHRYRNQPLRKLRRRLGR